MTKNTASVKHLLNNTFIGYVFVYLYVSVGIKTQQNLKAFLSSIKLNLPWLT